MALWYLPWWLPVMYWSLEFGAAQYILIHWKCIFCEDLFDCPNFIIVMGEGFLMTPSLFFWPHWRALLGSPVHSSFILPRYLLWWASDLGLTILLVGWESGLLQQISSQLYILHWPCISQYSLRIYLYAIFVWYLVGSFGAHKSNCSWFCITYFKLYMYLCVTVRAH